MKADGGFGSKWMTDLINNIVKEGCIPDDWRKSILVPMYKGKGDPIVSGSYRAIKLLEQLMKVLESVGKEDQMACVAPNYTAYKRWSRHKLLCKLCQTFPPPVMGAQFTVFFGQAGHADPLALLLTKAGDVKTNPGPTTSHKRVWICDICHKQVHVRKQIHLDLPSKQGIQTRTSHRHNTTPPGNFSCLLKL